MSFKSNTKTLIRVTDNIDPDPLADISDVRYCSVKSNMLADLQISNFDEEKSVALPGTPTGVHLISESLQRAATPRNSNAV